MVGTSAGDKMARRPWWVNYGAAVLIQVGLTAALRWIHPYFPLADFPAPYAAALLVTVVLFGVGPAVVALVLSLLAFTFYFIPPAGLKVPSDAQAWAAIAAYVIITSNVVAAVAIIQRGKRKAERLAESLEERSHTVDLAHLFVKDMDDVITFWNQGAEMLYGFSQDAAVGRAAHDLLRTQFPRPPEEIKQELLRTGEWEGELIQTKQNGTLVNVTSHWAIHRDADGSPMAVIEVNNDITGRIQAQRALEKALQELAALNQEKETINDELRVSNEELQQEIANRARAEARVRTSEEQISLMADSIPQLAWMAEPDGFVSWYNRRWYEYTGTTPEQMEGWGWQSVHDPEVLPAVMERWEASLASGEPFDMEFPLRGADGRFRPFLTRILPMKDAEGRVTRWFGTNTDITERKRAEREREITVDFLRLVNESRETRDLVRAAAMFFQMESGCEAVGIRIREGDDYPYFEARGFEERFVEAENKLCRIDKAGCAARDANGYPIMECLCGMVVQGRFDTSKPYFTEHGSFWTNSACEVFASRSLAGSDAGIRSTCGGEGYKSIALIPLHAGNERLGLLQLNDHREGMFTLETIELWERFGDYLSTAISKFAAEESLRHSEAHKRDFYRETIRAATEGKLIICEPDEISEMAGEKIGEWDVKDIADLGTVRHATTEMARQAGLDPSRIYDFMGCVVESVGNAAKHARGGHAALYRQDHSLLFVISDSGPGIGAMRLPDVALTRGYTTAGTLGMGYKVMIGLADKVYLATSPEGTTVATEMALSQANQAAPASI